MSVCVCACVGMYVCVCLKLNNNIDHIGAVVFSVSIFDRIRIICCGEKTAGDIYCKYHSSIGS